MILRLVTIDRDAKYHSIQHTCQSHEPKNHLFVPQAQGGWIDFYVSWLTINVVYVNNKLS